MKALIQRVKEARVRVDGEVVGEINQGVLVFLGVEKTDQKGQAKALARRVSDFRLFSDQKKNSNLSVVDIGGEILVVSQFTLCAETDSGRRPSFTRAADPEKAKHLYELFLKEIALYSGLKVESGEFAKMMEVVLVNDGPATFLLEEEGGAC
jgi:D-aminoacyl-tRNA deacylase